MEIGTRVRVVTFVERVRFTGTVRGEDGEIVYVHNPKTDQVVGVPRIFVRPVSRSRA